MARASQPPWPLFRVFIDHGLTTQILFLRVRSAGDAMDAAFAALARDGIPYARVSRMSCNEVPSPQ
jgi:hypothetical protein